MGGVPFWWLHEAMPGSGPAAKLVRLHALGLDRVLLGPPVLPGVEWPEVFAALRSGPLKPLAVAAWPWFQQVGPAAHLTAPGASGALEAAVRLAGRARTDLVLVPPGMLPVGQRWQGDLRGRLSDPGAVVREAAAIRAASRDSALDQVCRLLHAACRRSEGIRFSLHTGADPAGLDRPEDLEAILDDLGRTRIGVWLDVPAAALREAAGDPAMGAWLDRLGPDLDGVSLADALPGRPGLTPGTGLVDFRLLADFIKLPGRTLPWSLELDPAAGLAGLAEALEALRRWGLA